MQETLISFETAKLAKEKEFNLNSPAFYGCDYPHGTTKPNQLIIRDWVKFSELGSIDEQGGTLVYSAPTQSLLQKWLREVHKIHITIFSSSQESWMFRITKVGQKLEEGLYGEDYSTYEEALEAGLQESLKLI